MASSIGEMDSLFHSVGMGPLPRERILRESSKYVFENCFVGASCMSRSEEVVAIQGGLAHKYM